MKSTKPTLYTTSSVRTVSGLYVDVLNPTPEMFDIEDIAHSLSQQCRFGGHLKQFYSVAQHCYYASKRVSKKYQLAALMHDAAEFVMLDMPRPIKDHLQRYKEIEDGIIAVIAKKYGFEFPFHPEIKRVDNELLELEHDNLVIGPCTHEIQPMAPPVAKHYFIQRFKELTSNG